MKPSGLHFDGLIQFLHRLDDYDTDGFKLIISNPNLILHAIKGYLDDDINSLNYVHLQIHRNDLRYQKPDS